MLDNPPWDHWPSVVCLAGSSVTQLQAIDPENEPLIYGISGEEAMKYFSVNDKTGVVWLRQQLDREVNKAKALIHILLQMHWTRNDILYFFAPLSLCWHVSVSSPDQVRDAGWILREWQSRGKRQICTKLSYGILTTFSLSVFFSCYHTDTCLTPSSLVLVTVNLLSSPWLILCTLLLSFTLNPACCVFSNLRRCLWNGFTKVLPPSGGQGHGKHPDWRREWQCANLPRTALRSPNPRGKNST